MRELSPSFLRGSLPPLVTPFRDGKVDFDEFARQVDRHVGTSHGVVVTGTSGEPAGLTVAERCELYRVAVATSAGRIPVVAATGSQSLADTLELSAAADRAGADALLVVTPYYSKPSQQGLLAWYRSVAAHSELPLMLYHIPGRAGVTVTPDTVGRLAAELDSFVGVKHSAYDLLWQTEVRSLTGPEFRILVGVEELSVPMLLLGADGLVNAAANIAPDLIADLYDTVMAGDLGKAREEHYRLYPLNRAVFYETNPVPVKYMMKRTGVLPSNEHRPPLQPADQALSDRLDAVLKDLALLPGGG